MKKFNTFILLLLFGQQLSASTFYEQLCNFNFNWKKYESCAPAGEARYFISDKEYIQAHLGSVLEILRSNPVDGLDAKQLKSRLHLIEVLDAYRSAGNFPMNYYRRERIPVFIDEHNTHCAVGYLLQQTGYEYVARRIAAADNYVWVKDIHDPDLPSWQEASGFTMEELKLIQGAYDSYMPNAFIVANRYEIPQKPSVMLAYFDHKEAKPENVWLKGEGTNGMLNGRWVQNYASGMPWIVGYYENGKRSGQWQEYYQGTKLLCRTENWRNDKLNGTRKRFNKEGKLIEEILFKDGKAVTKTNYSLADSLVWVRQPLDSILVWTQVFNSQGSLIAFGHEKIYNPGNLQWFQNIPLTALNSASFQSYKINNNAQAGANNENIISLNGINLYDTPPLVEYRKEGYWVYYKEYNYSPAKALFSIGNFLDYDYAHFGRELRNSISVFGDSRLISGYDSIQVEYEDDNVQNFYGYGPKDFNHFQIHYYEPKEDPFGTTLVWNSFFSNTNGFHYERPVIKECGQYNKANEKIGTWKHFTREHVLYKTENYLVAWKEDEE